jgi:hypothetical protein
MIPSSDKAAKSAESRDLIEKCAAINTEEFDF